MDPNAALAEIRRIRERANERAAIGYDPVEDAAALDRLVELTEALDEWLSGGGFLPDAWGRQSAGPERR